MNREESYHIDGFIEKLKEIGTASSIQENPNLIRLLKQIVDDVKFLKPESRMIEVFESNIVVLQNGGNMDPEIIIDLLKDLSGLFSS